MSYQELVEEEVAKLVAWWIGQGFKGEMDMPMIRLIAEEEVIERLTRGESK